MIRNYIDHITNLFEINLIINFHSWWNPDSLDSIVILYFNRLNSQFNYFTFQIYEI